MPENNYHGNGSSNSKSTGKFVTAACLGAMIASLLISFILIAALVWIPVPNLLQFLGYEKSMVLTDPQNINDFRSAYMVGELVKDGTILSLKDYWGFQSSFYTTIITILVAINGLVAAAVVFYIRGSSHEKAEEAAESYLKSELFEIRLYDKSRMIADDSLKIAQQEYGYTIDDIGLINDEISRLITENDRLDGEYKEIKQQLRVIADRISQSDRNESEGDSFELSRGD